MSLSMQKQIEYGLYAKEIDNGWICQIKDQGIGFTDETYSLIKAMDYKSFKSRARDMEWEFSMKRIENETIVEIKKGAEVDAAFSNTYCR